MSEDDLAPLALFTVEEIMDEFEKRFETVLLVTHRVHTCRSDQTQIIYKGSNVHALGLAQAAQLSLIQDFGSSRAQ